MNKRIFLTFVNEVFGSFANFVTIYEGITSPEQLLQGESCADIETFELNNDTLKLVYSEDNKGDINNLTLVELTRLLDQIVLYVVS